MESADFTLKLTLYALFAWGASILIAAIPTNSKVAYRIQWLVVRGITIVGALCTFIGFLSVFGVTSKAWGWPWYLSMLSTMMYVGVMSMAQWSTMKLTKGIWFDDKQPPK